MSNILKIKSLKTTLLLFHRILTDDENDTKRDQHPDRFTLPSVYTRDNIDPIEADILEKMFPNFFNANYPIESTGLYDFYSHELQSSVKIDLSNMNLERIPISIVERLSNIKSLNLSGNHCLKIEEEWFEYFYDNLEELILNDCNIRNEDLAVINNCKSLKKLSLIKSKRFSLIHLSPILKKLTHLDVSTCNLNEMELHFILEQGNNLTHLDFNNNNLANLSQEINNNLKVLNVSNCKLKSKEHLGILLNIKTLEEINLSDNNFSKVDYTKMGDSRYGSSITKKLGLNYNEIQPKNYEGNLKHISLSHCKIKNQEFIRLLFDIKGLETIILNGNFLNFDFEEIVKGRAKDSLARLNLSNCEISSDKNLKLITDFNILQFIDISWNTFSSLPEDFELGKSKESLVEIICDKCGLTYQAINPITSCLKLETLNISLNDLGGCPKDFSLGISKDVLKNIKASNCNLNPHGLKAFTDCLNLDKLDVYGNEFSDIHKPIELGKSRNSLKEINISYCNLTPHDLKVITDCPKLEKLNVYGNQFSDINEKIELGESRASLKELDLSDCELTLNGLREIAVACLKLQKLIIEDNDFEVFPNDFNFGNIIRTIKEINAKDCNLTDYRFLEEIAKCLTLETLDISGNEFQNIPENFSFDELRYSIRTLKLSDCKFNSNGLKAIFECERIEHLYINNNDFRVIPNEFVLKFRNYLKSLNLGNCDVNPSQLRIFTNCPNLRTLKAYGNALNVADEAFILGSSKNSLKEVDLDYSRANEQILREFTDCPVLQNLELAGIDCTGLSDSFEFGRSKYSLRNLKLSRIKSNNNFLKSISECVKLTNLDLSNCALEFITSNFSFNNLENTLRVLNLKRSQINDSLLKAISYCDELKSLDISGCRRIAEYSLDGAIIRKLSANIDDFNDADSD